MHLINIPQVDQVIEFTVIGENEPCWFHGEPGCGKSAGIAAAIARLGAQLIDFRLGQYDTVDFKGFPDIDRETNTTVWHPASTLPVVGNPRFDPEQVKVVFFDEADHGKDSVKGVCYQALQERRVGEHVFMDNTYFCAAGNRPQDRGVGGKNPPPLNNRCTHYSVGPDADSWTMWAATQPRMPGELLAFLQFRKDLISNFDPKSVEPAFATPRTWEKAGRYYTSPMPEEIKLASIEGAVGEAAFIEFTGFCEVIKDMPSMRQIKENPTGISTFEDKPEVRWAIAVGIGGEMAPDNISAYQQYLDRLDVEFNILAWQIGLRKNEQVIGTKEFIKISRDHQALFAAANKA